MHNWLYFKHVEVLIDPFVCGVETAVTETERILREETKHFASVHKLCESFSCYV